MRILIFLASSGQGGAEALTASLANQLAKHSATHAVAVLCFSDSLWLDQLDPAIERIELGKECSRHHPRLWFKLLQGIRHFKPDIVHSHGAKAAQLIERLMPFCSTLHIATKHNARKGKIFDRLAHVVAVSGQVAASIQHPVEVIYNGIAPIDPPARKLPPEITLLAVGRLDPIKQYHRLIEALSETRHPIHLRLVGEGDERPRLEALIEQKQLSQRIQLLGHCRNIPEQMATAHAVVICSRTEGFSLVMVESLFYANMLLSTDVGGASEVLEAEQIFAIETLAARLDQLAEQYPAEQQRFMQLTEQKAAEFTLEKMTDHYIRYYQSQRMV